MGGQKAAGTVGLWFALGHSTVVFVLYNLAVSITAALIIGLIESLGPLTAEPDVTTGPLSRIAAIDLNGVGYVVAVVFVVTCLLALAVWRCGPPHRARPPWPGH